MKTMLTAVAALVAAVTLLGAAPAATTGARIATASSRLGTILVDGRGRTLYLFEKDTRGHSACSGACTTFWLPLRTSARPVAGRGVKQSLLGVVRRADGTTQASYAGHPLYRFVQDAAPGQTTGQALNAFGADWYVVSPAGRRIEHGRS